MDQLIDEIRFVVDEDWEKYVDKPIRKDAESIKSLRDDLSYLLEMKAMDEKIWKGRKKSLPPARNNAQMRQEENIVDGKGEEGEGEGDGEGEGEEKRGFEITPVVPVGGLFMARFHSLQVEMDTLLEINSVNESSSYFPVNRVRISNICLSLLQMRKSPHFIWSRSWIEREKKWGIMGGSPQRRQI
jgi:hypothetical protein